jgi:DHA1 family tetracycline resistance protein-like MFS transporter
MSMRRATFAFIFFTVCIDMLALGIIAPVFPKLVIALEGGDQVNAAAALGVFGTTWAAVQFLFAPLLGAVSDRFGRRPVILVSCIGLGLDYVVMALAPSLTWLFVGRIVSGITASSFATSFAYVADVTEPQKRAARFGFLGAAFGLGFILGPVLGGLLATFGLRAPFWAAAVLSLAGALYGFFVLPESLPRAQRAMFNWRRANPIGAIDMLQRHGSALLGLTAAVFLYRLAHDALPTLFVIYGDYRYHWTPRDVGLALAAVGVASMIVQAGLVGRVVGKFGERRAMIAGFTFGAIAMAIYGAAPSGGLFLIGIPFGGLFGFTYASLQGLATRHVSAREQGRLQGALASVMGLAGVVAPLMFTQVFAYAIAPQRTTLLPGAPFLLAAALLLSAAAIGAAATRSEKPFPVRDPASQLVH